MIDQTNSHLHELLRLVRQDEKTGRLLQYAILGSMTHGIGYELLNCLKSIEGYINLALKSTLLPPKTKSFLERSLECCESGQRFNSVSLDLSWDADGPENTDSLERILLDVARFCDSGFGPYCAVQLVLSGPPPETYVPAIPLKQILFNLCATAREYIKGQGQIILSIGRNGPLGPSAAESLLLHVHAHSTRSRIRGGGPPPSPSPGARDTDCGIPASQLTSISLLLAEIEASRQGMALASETQGADGFSATLTLPVQPGARPLPGFSAARNEPDRSRPLRLILLEDQDLIADFLETILEAKGHQVKVFGHGGELADALGATLDPSVIDVYLLDVCVPGRSGLEVGLKARDIDPQSRIVFYSAIHGESDIKDFFDLDEKTKFLKKPFKINELLETVEQVMDERISW